MALIIGLDILPDTDIGWRKALREELIDVTTRYRDLFDNEEIRCSFPVDPSIPTDPYPTVSIIVVHQEVPVMKPKSSREFVCQLAFAAKHLIGRFRGEKTEVHVILRETNKQHATCIEFHTKYDEDDF